MGSHCSIEYLKHKLWPKEGQGVKLPIWLPTRKSQESTQFTWLQRACNLCWKALNKNYNFASNCISIPSLFAKLWGSKVAGIPICAFQDSHSRVPGEKNHLDVGFMASHKIYYKGEGGGFPQVRAVMNLVCPCCSWLILAPKVLQLCINHFVWVVWRPVWVSEACQLFLVPSWSSNTPLYPSKCCELGSMPQLLPLSLSSTWTHIWVLQGVGNASYFFKIKFLILILESTPKIRLNSLVENPPFATTFSTIVQL
jgi:hypothetical protein